MWKCGVCGYIHDGSEAPEKCPKCGAPKEKFMVIPGEKAQLIEKSRLTNQIHMELSARLEQIADLAEEGIAENLDPPCVQLFTRAREEAKLLQQMIKAEIETHVGKGKWG